MKTVSICVLASSWVKHIVTSSILKPQNQIYLHHVSKPGRARSADRPAVLLVVLHWPPYSAILARLAAGLRRLLASRWEAVQGRAADSTHLCGGRQVGTVQFESLLRPPAQVRLFVGEEGVL